MILIHFGKWSSKATNYFIYNRVYKNGYKWTPFIEMTRRYRLDKPSNIKQEKPLKTEANNMIIAQTEKWRFLSNLPSKELILVQKTIKEIKLSHLISIRFKAYDKQNIFILQLFFTIRA